MSKIIVFGLDGGSLRLIEQWKEELPNFKKIMEGGVFGELESTVPNLTCPAWPCMFTGKNPGKLGMYDFVSLRFSNEYGSRVFSSSDYHDSSVWSILNDHGKQVGLFNVPMTFPPHKIDGFIVCGIGTPGTTTRYTYPASLAKTLDKIVGGYEVEPVMDLTLYGRETRYSKVSREMLNKRLKVARYLMTNFHWDLCVCVFRATDLLQHYFWHHMDASHPRHSANSKYKDVIKDCYKHIDEDIGILMDEASQDSNILVVSDHGFGPLHGRFLVNKWL
ncbi:MAG: alkaline phosphatase family protein, partial [Chloroflexota bacterium]